MGKRVVVGLSGGVDSAVSAHILKSQGFDVIGLYMSNWKDVEDDGCCTGEQDYSDAKRTAARLDIPFYSVDFAEQYMESVFKLFVEEYKKGRTPNPDVLCNREVKFGPFADFARGLGADFIATGHYCRIREGENGNELLRAADENKCQTYFLNQVRQSQLKDVIFPVGGLNKDEVRKLAGEIGLSVASKKDSTGICFIGERRFREFLSRYIPMQEGDIVTTEGEVVGKHQGVYFYTLGQRRGLGIGGKAGAGEGRWFVLSRDIQNNVLVVSNGEEDILFGDTLTAEGFNWITPPPADEFDCLCRIRHRQPLQKCRAKILPDGNVHVVFEEKQRAIAAGQYAVLYKDQICLGGGVII
jgi:tRNA-specific 2-thiouridylase